MRLHTAFVMICLAGCNLSPYEDTAATTTTTTSTVTVVDCTTASQSLRKAGEKLKNLSLQVDDVCIDGGANFSDADCTTKIASVSTALADVVTADQDVQDNCPGA